MRQRKFIKGRRLTFIEAMYAVDCSEYVFDGDKPQHPGWIISWPLRVLRDRCRRGWIYEAIRNPEYKERNQ